MGWYEEALHYYEKRIGISFERLAYVERFPEEFGECFARQESLATFDDWTKMEELSNQKIPFDTYMTLRNRLCLDVPTLNADSPEVEEFIVALEEMNRQKELERDRL